MVRAQVAAAERGERWCHMRACQCARDQQRAQQKQQR